MNCAARVKNQQASACMGTLTETAAAAEVDD
jgi:hypothetical protein